MRLLPFSLQLKDMKLVNNQRLIVGTFILRQKLLVHLNIYFPMDYFGYHDNPPPTVLVLTVLLVDICSNPSA